MVEEYLTLLRETLDQLINMHKACDPSVADYVLQLETASQFIYKALKTEDILDIFKALQKAYDVLEKEDYDDQPENEDYNDLVERLKAALEGLQENTIKKSYLKKLTKFVLKEISMIPGQGGQHSMQQLFPAIMSMMEPNKPLYVKRIKYGHKQAHKILGNMIKDFKLLVSACLKKDDQSISKAKKRVAYDGERLIDLLMHWAKEIYETESSKKNELDVVINMFRDNFNLMSIQGKEMYDSLVLHQNYIKASEEADRVNESFNGMRESIDGLFKIGLDIDYDKRKRVRRKKGELIWPDVPFTMKILFSQNPYINKETIRQSLADALKNKSIIIKGKIMPLGGKGIPILIFMKNK